MPAQHNQSAFARAKRRVYVFRHHAVIAATLLTSVGAAWANEVSSSTVSEDNGWIQAAPANLTPWTRIGEVPSQDASAARATYFGNPNPVNGVIQTVASATKSDDPEIRSLALSLGNDPLREYEWVKNNIKTEFYLGAMRGPRLTYLERAGNDVDQCALLGALFAVSGIEHNYYSTNVWLPRTASGTNEVGVYEWLGVTDDASALSMLFQSNGATYGNDRFMFGSMWLAATIAGRGVCFFAPSIKPQRVGSQIDLDALSGYTKADLVAASSSTSVGTGAYPATRISSAGLRSYLTTLLTTASGALHSSSTSHSANGAQLAQLPSLMPAPLVVGTGVVRFPAGLQVASNWGEEPLNGIPVSYTARFHVKLGTGCDKWLACTELAGFPLSCEFSANGNASIKLNGTEIASDASAGSTAISNLVIELELPFAWYWEVKDGENVPIRRTATGTMLRQNSVAIIYSFGRTLGRLQEESRLETAKELASPSTATTTDRLQIIGLQYLSQCDELKQLMDAFGGYSLPRVFLGGFVYQTDRPHTDIGINQSTMYGLRRASAQSVSAVGSTTGIFIGALEGTAIEQLTQQRSFGVSTIFDQAMAMGTQSAIYVDSSNSGAILTTSYLPNYGATALANLQAHINNGGKLLLVKNGQITYTSGGNSTGLFGYFAIYPEGGVASLFNADHGGAAGVPAPVATNTTTATAALITWTNVTLTPINLALVTSKEPVDLSTGAYLLDHLDLAVGDEGCRGLRLERHYNSASRLNDPVGLGGGWTHNYNIKLSSRSASDFDASRASADEMLPLLIASRAMQDILTQEPSSSRSWLIAATAATWAVDQLINSRATVTMGARTLEFVQRPDGSYAPPAGVNATLVKSGTTATLSFLHGDTIVFGSTGKFTSITDQFGNQLTPSYNADGSLYRVTDACNRWLQFYYTGTRLYEVHDSTGRVVKYGLVNGNFTFTDAAGKSQTLLMDGGHRLTGVLDARGRTSILNYYDAWDQVYEQETFADDDTALEHPRTWKVRVTPGVAIETDPLGKTNRTYFDAAGRKIAAVDQIDQLSTWDYDGANRLIQSASPRGGVSKFKYNSDHILVEETNPLNHTRTITVDAGKHPENVGNFEGKTTDFTYTTQHAVESVTTPGGLKTEYRYYSDGRPWKVHPVSFAADKWIVYTYDDPQGYMQRSTATYPDSTTEISDFNARGDLIQFIDRRGKKSTYEYNERRQRISSAAWTGSYTATSTVGGTPPADSLLTTTHYDDAGDVDYVLDGAGNKTSYEHDVQGHLLTVTGPDTVVQADNVYDSRNLLDSSLDALGNQVVYHYDDATRLSSVDDPLVRATTFGYDADAHRTSVTTQLGYVTTDVFDLAGYKSTTTDALTKVITYGTDKDGRSTSLKNRLNNTFSTTYDDDNRKVTSKTPLNKATVEERNARGLVAKVTKPSLQTIESTEFDDEGRLKTQVLKRADGTVETTLTMTYYANGLLNTVTDTPTGGTAHTTTRTYDDLNRLFSYADGEGNTIGYRYDSAGNLYQLIYPGGSTVTYRYDSYNRLKQVEDWSHRVTTYTYDDAGRLVRVDRPNLTWRKLVYDAAGEVRQIEEHDRNNGIIWLQARKYDLDGNMNWSFTLPAPQVFSLPGDVAEYDNDNRLQTWTPGGGSAQSVTHDDDGNMTTGPLPSASLGSYGFDVRNRLTSAGGVSYRYNPDNLRVQAGSVSYVVDPGAALSRVLSRNNGGTVTRYVWGLGLIYEDTNTSTKTYHSDALGSTVALTDDGGTTVTDRVEYAPFGTVTYRTGSSDTPFLLHGGLGVVTDGNGLAYMRARYYNPRLMRFCNADPIGFSGGLNWYAYVENNPISRTDPSGLWFGIDDAIFAGGGALIGVGGKLAANWVTGTPTTWQDVVGAAVGGAAGGETLLYTANPFLAGAAGGAAGNLATQGLNLATGKATEFSGTSLAVDTGVGALTGFIPGVKVQGITAGKGSAVAVFHQVVTKASNGTISSVTTQTAGKMAVGAGTRYAVAQGAIVGAGVSNLASQAMAGNDDDYGEVVVLPTFVVTAPRGRK